MLPKPGKGALFVALCFNVYLPFLHSEVDSLTEIQNEASVIGPAAKGTSHMSNKMKKSKRILYAVITSTI